VAAVTAQQPTQDDNADDAWLRSELARRANAQGKLIPHHEVMEKARKLIVELKARHEHA